MNRTVAICTLLGWAALWAVLVVATPWAISDQNKFFKGFVNEQFLGFMGVVVTITLASAANLYIELNKLEEKLDKQLFLNTKREVRTSAYFLIGALVAAILTVIMKPLFDCGARSEAIMNGCAITILILSILTLIDLTQAAFNLDPHAGD